MQNNDIPVRATSFLHESEHGLTRNGIYDIYEESKKRSIIILSRIEKKKAKEKEVENECAASQLLTWNIYAKHLDSAYDANLRLNNELRKEFLLFISLISEYLLSETFCTNQVCSATYFILRAIYRIYKEKQLNKGNTVKIKKFIQKIRNEITKYFNKISDKQFNKMYNIGCKLLYFLSPSVAVANNKLIKCDPLKLFKELSAETCQFDCDSIKLFCKEKEKEKVAEKHYKLNRKEYGKDIEFKDPLIQRNQLLLPNNLQKKTRQQHKFLPNNFYGLHVQNNEIEL